MTSPSWNLRFWEEKKKKKQDLGLYPAIGERIFNIFTSQQSMSPIKSKNQKHRPPSKQVGHHTL